MQYVRPQKPDGQGYDFIERVRSFMLAGGQTVHQFNAKQVSLYLGLQLEEMSEKLTAVQGGCTTKAQAAKFDSLITMLKMMSQEFRGMLFLPEIQKADPCEMLDADIDLAWVSIGAMLSVTLNGWEAMAVVANANDAKFPNGVPTRDASGKIVKPNGWQPPDLSQLVRFE